MSGKLKIDEDFKKRLSLIISGDSNGIDKSVQNTQKIPPPPPISQAHVAPPLAPPVAPPVALSQVVYQTTPPPQPQIVYQVAPNVSQNTNQKHNEDLMTTINSLSFMTQPITTLLKYIVEDHINKNKEQNNIQVNTIQQVNTTQQNEKITTVIKKPLNIPHGLHQHKNSYNHGLRMRKL